MKTIKVFVFLVLSCQFSKAQYALVKNYQFNYLSVNPALAGEQGAFALKGILGNQFNGTLRPNQVSQVLVIDGQLYNKAGMAFQGFRSNSGNVMSTGFSCSYSKGFQVGDLQLKAGSQMGLIVQPNLLFAQGNQWLSPYMGFGLMGGFKGLFAGLSKPMLLYSKSITEAKPVYFNLGYLFNTESPIGFNINTLVAYETHTKIKNLDFNVKLNYNKRVGVGVSWRNNKLYNDYNSKATTLLPFVEYQISKSMLLGLSYDKQPSSLQNSTSMIPVVSGVFQLMFRYNNAKADNESWYYNKL
jgi:type IX secretion system PorP/SprF family membrane protein